MFNILFRLIALGSIIIPKNTPRWTSIDSFRSSKYLDRVSNNHPSTSSHHRESLFIIPKRPRNTIPGPSRPAYLVTIDQLQWHLSTCKYYPRSQSLYSRKSTRHPSYISSGNRSTSRYHSAVYQSAVGTLIIPVSQKLLMGLYRSSQEL